MAEDTNTRAVIGGNQAPDWAKLETERLLLDYGPLVEDSEKLLAEARDAPKEINDEETAGKVSDLVVRMRSFARRVDQLRVVEKEPHLRRGNAVQAFYDLIHLRLTRKDKDDKAGAADILHASVHDWNDRKLAAERERLRKEEEARLAEEARLRAEQLKAQREAEEAKRKADAAAAAAERARKAENIQAHEAAAAAAAAEAKIADDAAAAAKAAADKQAQAAEDARIDQMRKPADHVRTRTEGGALNTMRQIGEAKLIDKARVNLEILRPFLKDEHVEMALRAWAKTTGHKTQMDGAIIRMVNDTVLR